MIMVLPEHKEGSRNCHNCHNYGSVLACMEKKEAIVWWKHMWQPSLVLWWVSLSLESHQLWLWTQLGELMNSCAANPGKVLAIMWYFLKWERMPTLSERRTFTFVRHYNICTLKVFYRLWNFHFCLWYNHDMLSESLWLHSQIKLLAHDLSVYRKGEFMILNYPQ